MTDYKYIRAWGKMSGSFPYYISGEVEKARRDNAPDTAIYRRQDGTWAVFEDIECEKTKGALRAILQREQASNDGLCLPSRWVYVCYEDGTEEDVAITDNISVDEAQKYKDEWENARGKKVIRVELRSNGGHLMYGFKYDN